MKENREPEPEPKAAIFDLSWESDEDSVDAPGRQELEPEPDERDVEAHGSGGFNRPE